MQLIVYAESLNRIGNYLKLILNTGDNPDLANPRFAPPRCGFCVGLYISVSRTAGLPACILRLLDAGQITLHIQYVDNSSAYCKKRKLLFFLLPLLFVWLGEQSNGLTWRVISTTRRPLVDSQSGMTVKIYLNYLLFTKGHERDIFTTDLFIQ